MASAHPILILDPSAASRRELGEAFERGGLVSRSIADPAQTLIAARALRPELIFVASEIRGETLVRALESLAPDAARSQTPIALLSEDTSESRFCDQLRTGVVALFQKPFYAPKHLGEVRALLSTLPQRSGTVSGNGDSRELAQLVEHVRRTRRSGVISVNARTPEEGRALFARGELKTAEHKGLHGVEALLSIVASPRGAWSLSEVGASQGEALIDMPATVGAHPLEPVDEVPVIEGAPLEEELTLEIGEISEDEEEVPIDEAPAANATRILFVDDDEALCRMFGLLFRKHGFEVDTAPDGIAGYELALSRRYEMVVADLNMPRMDGWGLLRLLRDDFRTRELPVAFLSCHDDYRETLRAMESGAQAYFSKQTRLDALASQVRALLEPRARAQKTLKSGATAPVQVSPGKLGPQWLVRELARMKVSGVLEAKDSWALYRLTFRGGALVHAFAQAGRHGAEGERAFNAYVASRGAEGSFTRGEFPVTPNLSGGLEELIASASTTLNENEQKIRDGLLVQAREIQIDSELYALYAEVGPRQWLETARLICEEKLPPREVIARVDASPLDVEETMRDLIRRGVLRLSA